MSAASRPPDLPEFKQPPLNELVLSVQFRGVDFKNVHAGLLRQRFAELYPNVEEQPPIDPVFETFGTAPARLQPQQLMVELSNTIGPLRYWFVSSDGNELLQVQADRVIHNWRHRKPEDQYPRYEPLRERFAGELATVAAFFRENGIGEIGCNQCEVSYINVISLDGVDDTSSRLSEIFTFWSEKYSDGGPGQLERGQFKMSFIIPSESGKEPFGRLHLEAAPVRLRVGNKSAVRLSVTTRGKPADDTIDGALSWLDRGREVGVRAFASVTTEKMHRLWERQ